MLIVEFSYLGLLSAADGKVSKLHNELCSGGPGGMIGKGTIEVFNEAAELARTGNPGKAFELYTMLAGRPGGNDKSVPDAFPAMVELRRAYCLMDLGRMRDALGIMKSPVMDSFKHQFEPQTLYEFYFAFGNILGQLGDTSGMDEHLNAALQVAAEQLGDLYSCESCWYYMMRWAKKNEQWALLEERCVSAHMFGKENGSSWLQAMALEFGCHAYRGLGKSHKAKQGAEVVLKRLRSANVEMNVIGEWERFLASVA